MRRVKSSERDEVKWLGGVIFVRVVRGRASGANKATNFSVGVERVWR